MDEVLLVAAVMTHAPQTVHPTASLREAVRLMVRGGFRRLPVVDETGQLVGIVTDRDIRLAVDSPLVLRERSHHNFHMTHVTVDMCMTSDPITVQPATPIADALQLLIEYCIGGLPVVMHGEVVDIVTETDVLRVFAELLETQKVMHSTLNV